MPSLTTLINQAYLDPSPSSTFCAPSLAVLQPAALQPETAGPLSNYIVIFADGAFLPALKFTSWAFLIFDKDCNILYSASGKREDGRNAQFAQLMAILEVLNVAIFFGHSEPLLLTNC